jgi:Fic family protein
LFSYDFVSIHPFQDGNGRLSRLIATLLLLKNGYRWIQYVSFEHEIENRKGEYYKELMQCQQQRPHEDVYPWIIFFLDCLNNISSQLMIKLTTSAKEISLAPKEKSIYMFVENHPGLLITLLKIQAFNFYHYIYSYRRNTESENIPVRMRKEIIFRHIKNRHSEL